jgi:NitT/TauT family transport system substrate-binding protein
MSARVGMSQDPYKALMGGTHFLDAKGNLDHIKAGETLMSVYGTSKVVEKFQLDKKIYKAPVAYDQYLDPSLVEEVAATFASN